MLPLVRRAAAPVVLMHMQGTPATMQDGPHYDDVVARGAALPRRARPTRRARAGIARRSHLARSGHRLRQDACEHNLALLAAARPRSSTLGYPGAGRRLAQALPRHAARRRAPPERAGLARGRRDARAARGAASSASTTSARPARVVARRRAGPAGGLSMSDLQRLPLAGRRRHPDRRLRRLLGRPPDPRHARGVDADRPDRARALLSRARSSSSTPSTGPPDSSSASHSS